MIHLKTEKKLLIDISDVVKRDRRTGIQRVARALLQAFLTKVPEGFKVEPIYLDRAHVYRYARHYLYKEHGIGSKQMIDQPVSLVAGDIYLGVDLYTAQASEMARIYQDWRSQGVLVAQVIYDLLPISNPEWFLPKVAPEFKEWLNVLTRNTDLLLAISRTVAQDIETWIRHQGVPEPYCPNVGWFHLGADIAASLPNAGFDEGFVEIIHTIQKRPSFLMVATIEPRKGHAQVLSAFEKLWAQGQQINLVLVGKKGWLVDGLINRIQAHPERGNRLFWLEGVSDQCLEALYPRCTALLAASEGEGFGLPIVEAARHGIPVLARDIPVFREVARNGATYFSADTPDALSTFLNGWLKLSEKSRKAEGDIPTIKWQESAQQIWQRLAQALVPELLIDQCSAAKA